MRGRLPGACDQEFPTLGTGTSTTHGPVEAALIGLLAGRPGAVTERMLEHAGDRHHLVTLCRRHAVHLLAADLLRTPAGGGLRAPHPVLAELESDKDRRCSFLLSAEAGACAIHQALGDCEIPFCLLKGLALVHTLYSANPLQRCLGDIDILVPDARMDATLSAFQQAGCRIAAHTSDTEAIRRFGHKVCLVSRGPAPVTFDVHFRPLGKKLFERTARMPGEDFFAGSTQCHIAGRAFRVPDPDLHLLYLCVHLSLQHHLASLNWLYDIKAFTAGPVAWDRLVARTHAYRVCRAVRMSLLAARELLDAEVPEHVIDALSAGRPGLIGRVWQASRRDGANIIARTHDYRQRTIMGKFARMFSEALLVDRATDRWRCVAEWVFPAPLHLRTAYRVRGVHRLLLCYLVHPFVLAAMAVALVLSTAGYVCEQARRRLGLRPRWKPTAG